MQQKLGLALRLMRCQSGQYRKRVARDVCLTRLVCVPLLCSADEACAVVVGFEAQLGRDSIYKEDRLLATPSGFVEGTGD